jgi:hypothetical protein
VFRFSTHAFFHLPVLVRYGSVGAAQEQRRRAHNSDRSIKHNNQKIRNYYIYFTQSSKLKQGNEEERSTGLEDEDSEVEQGPKNKRKERVILLQKISVVDSSSNVNGIVVFAVNESSLTGSTSTAKSNAIGRSKGVSRRSFFFSDIPLLPLTSFFWYCAVKKGKELIRFDLMSPSKTDDEMANLRDEFIDRIISLMEWEHKTQALPSAK